MSDPEGMVAKPAGTPHAFWNASDEPARVLEIIAPGVRRLLRRPG